MSIFKDGDKDLSISNQWR